MNYIKIFRNAQAFSVFLGNNYLEDKLMHIFLDNFRQGEKYSAQIASHQAELRRDETFSDQKYLFISSLHTDYLNIDISSGCVKDSERENLVQKKCTFCGGANHSAENNPKVKARTDGDLENRRKERTPCKFFTCRYEDHLIAVCPKPPKYNYKR